MGSQEWTIQKNFEQLYLKTGGQLGYSRRVTSSWSTIGICCLTHDKNQVISHEKKEENTGFDNTENGTYQWLFVTHTFRNSYRSQEGDRESF